MPEVVLCDAKGGVTVVLLPDAIVARGYYRVCRPCHTQAGLRAVFTGEPMPPVFGLTHVVYKPSGDWRYWISPAGVAAWPIWKEQEEQP